MAWAGSAELPLGQLVSNRAQRLPIWTVDRSGCAVVGLMSKAIFAGVRPTYVLGLASGEILVATANHPLLTMDGWLRVDELTLGDTIASLTGATSELALGWDVLTMIEPTGSRPVYDLSVPESHNFIANGVVVHNSSWA
jgi:replicative DNA helicase